MKKLSSLFLCLIFIFVCCGCEELNGNNSSDFLFVTSVESIEESVSTESSELSSVSAVSSEVIVSNTQSIVSSNANSKTENNSTSNQVSKPINKPVTDNEKSPVKEEAPVVDKNNDATADHTDKINDAIKNEIGNKTDLSDDDWKKIWAQVALNDGVIFSNRRTAKDTDKVSMDNLYKKTPYSVYGEIETKIFDAMRKNEDYINTDIEYNDKNFEKFQTFAHEYFLKYGYYFVYGTADKNGTQKLERKYIWIDVKDTIIAKNNYNEPKAAKYIKQAIKDCGITEGMLQKDAIVKFNEYICKKVQYDYVNYTHDLNDFFEKGKAICNSYSQVFEILCRTVGIDAKFVGGTAGTEPHAWNEVTFSDGSKYLFDICWNDGDVIVNGKTYQKNDRFMFGISFPNRKVDYIMAVGYMEFL